MRTGQLMMAYILYIWLHFSDFYRLWPHAVISASCYLIKHSAEGSSSSSLVCVCTSALALAPAMQSHAVSAWCSVWGVLAHFSSYKKANTSALCEPAKIKLLTVKRLHQITERIFWQAMCLCNSPEYFFFKMASNKNQVHKTICCFSGLEDMSSCSKTSVPMKVSEIWCFAVLSIKNKSFGTNESELVLRKRFNCPRVPVSFQLGGAALPCSVFHSVWVFAPALLHSIVLTLPPVERGRVGLAGQVHSDHGDQLQASGTGFNFYSVEWQSMVAGRGNQVTLCTDTFQSQSALPITISCSTEI